MSNIKTVMASFFLPLSLLSVTLLQTLVLSHIVSHLPGFSGPLPFHLETGYVNVDEVIGEELFYYFTPSERNPADDPLLVWLTGGPGCSGLSALLYEIGPLKFDETEYIHGSIPSLVYNSYSWTKWLLKNPQFNFNDLYISGDSYAGKIVPIVAHYIAQDIEAGIQPLLGLKGYLIGNPLTREAADISSRIPFAHGQGLISDELYQTIRRYCTEEDYISTFPSNQPCAYALDSFELLVDGINTQNIIEPLCSTAEPKSMINAVGHRSLYQSYLSNTVLETKVLDPKCRSPNLVNIWANINSTRQALNIKEGTKNMWHRCNRSIPYERNVESSIIYHLNLTQKGYRALVYSGDRDMVIPFIGTQEWIRSLNYSIVDDWRSWHVKGQIAGYTRSYSNNLTFATVKDAGHTAPTYKPENCLMMLKRWIAHKPL